MGYRYASAFGYIIVGRYSNIFFLYILIGYSDSAARTVLLLRHSTYSSSYFNIHTSERRSSISDVEGGLRLVLVGQSAVENAKCVFITVNIFFSKDAATGDVPGQSHRHCTVPAVSVRSVPLDRG